MPLEDACGDCVDLIAFGDIADLPFAADLGSQRFEQLLAPGEEDAVPAAAVEGARRGLSDPRGRAGHDRYPTAAHRRVTLSV